MDHPKKTIAVMSVNREIRILQPSTELIKLWADSKFHSKESRRAAKRKDMAIALDQANQALICAGRFRDLCWAYHGMSPMDTIYQYKERGWFEQES